MNSNTERPTRSQFVGFWVTPRQADKLDAVCARDELTRSEVLRQLLSRVRLKERAA